MTHHEDHTPDEPKCHCSHVMLMRHDWRKVDWEGLSHGLRDLKRINWAVGAIFLMVAGIAVKEVWATEKSHIREDAPAGRNGEVLAPDRIEEPTR